MNILTLEFVKEHSRIIGDCEDQIIDVYATSAETTVLNHINRSLDEILEEYGEVPAPILHAMCLLADDGYKNRGLESPKDVMPGTIDRLLLPYVKLAN